MISGLACVAFFALALSSYALPSQPNAECSGITTVFRTVTVVAQPPLQTPNKGAGGSSSTNKGQNTKTPDRSKSTSSGNKDGGTTGKNNGGNKGSKVANKNNGGGKNNNNNPQTSLALDPRVIGKGFAKTGQEVPTPGQVPSLTTKNNFLNFCLTVPNFPITNGKQITTGSCNPVPMGVIPSKDHMPSSKFTSPKNFDTIKAGQTFTIEMAIKNMQTGFFVNAQANYFAAPQQLNKGGQIQGHSHVVIEKLDSLQQTQPTDPKKFAFFKGLNSAAQNGQLTTTVDKGLQPGVYRMTSINTSANHQPVLVPVAQHGFIDDAVYFTVTADGKPRKKSK